MQTGNYLGMFSNAEPDMIANHSVNMQAYVGTDVVPLYTSASGIHDPVLPGNAVDDPDHL